MLADSFQLEIARLQAADTARQTERAQRDAFILANFPTLDAAFVSLIDAAAGAGPRLALLHTVVTDHFTNHTFTSLNKTITEVRATLYGPVEIVRFTPVLQSVLADQFAAIQVSVDGVPDSATRADSVAAVMRDGYLMRGTETAALVAPQGQDFVPLTASLLEEFLRQLFVRTS